MEASQAAQNEGDIERCLALVAEDAIVDVGRERLEGKEQVRGFIEMLARLHARGSGPERQPGESGHVSTAWIDTDDVLRRLGVAALWLQADVSMREGVTASLYTRPTPESIALLPAAGAAGHRADGLRQAEQAGTPGEPASQAADCHARLRLAHPSLVPVRGPGRYGRKHGVE